VNPLTGQARHTGSLEGRSGPGPRVVAVLLVALLLFGVWRAVERAWMCDDSFISLRYADNLANGLGLVYNAGEHVEGYTNLAWTLLLAAGFALGLPPIPTAQALGIAAYVALAVCLAGFSWRRSRDRERPFLPLAAALVLVSEDFHTWATGGLETMLFTALALPGLLLTRASSPSLRAPLAAGALLAALALTRPDGLLFAAAGAASYWMPPGRLLPRDRWAHSAVVLLPVGLVLLVWIPFKLLYYGDLFPTAFYSKSVVGTYVSQGLVYVGLFLAKNWYLPLGLLLAAVGRRLLPADGASAEDWDDLFLIGAAGLYIAHLVQLGGDFMFARRVVPVVPLLLVVLEDQLARMPSARRRVALAACALIAAALPYPVYASRIAKRRLQGEMVGRALAGTDARVMFEGGMCVFGYYSRLPYLVEMTGLTQYSLAKMPLTERGHIGHEKTASGAWLTENGIHLVVSRRYPPIERRPGEQAFDEIYFSDVAVARIHLYSDEVMDPLRELSYVSFVPIEEVIEHVRRVIQRAPLEKAERAYEWLQRYYLRAAGTRGEAIARGLEASLEIRRRSGGS
jgi:arabinofuranosyltransferase